MIRAFIQARMSSSRFPGKALAPLAGRPLIEHVIARAAAAMPAEQIVVATSTDPADDALAEHVRRLGIAVFRGSLGNLVERFQGCLGAHPCDWFFRICADSPFLDETLFARMMAYADDSEADLVTNLFPRTFPHGQSLEMVRAETFAALDSSQLSAEEQEHATRVFYAHPEAFQIVNLEPSEPVSLDVRLAVDTPEDIPRLEQRMATVR
ncbi:MAG: NTP transferase domain-containing protein [Candidatus Omnitrophica bacterium]|nr:NTP transferase domain-containing protein [Candidatus Omnitrophota bacterium]